MCTSPGQFDCSALVIIARTLCRVAWLNDAVESTSAGLRLVACLSVNGKGTTMTSRPIQATPSEVPECFIVLLAGPFTQRSFQCLDKSQVERCRPPQADLVALHFKATCGNSRCTIGNGRVVAYKATDVV